MPISSFNFTSKTLSNSPADYILDINKYIPVGCLRIQRSECAISSEVWKSCTSWHSFAHPRDVYNIQSGLFLANNIQEVLLSSPVLQPYRAIHYAEWLRMEFKARDQHLGQIRVYILPDDVGRGSIDRQQSSLRKAMQLLIAQLDISAATWNGDWSEDTPVSHVDSSLDEKPKEDVSLFYLFNTLPSPMPDPEIVADRYARDAMYRILNSDIEGLTTKMHLYQRRSTAAMLQREAQPAQVIDPRLRPITDQKGVTWYCEIDAGSCFREPRTYEAARGGICAETMGLGKTLICLALILATRELSSQIPVEYSVGTVPIREKTGSLMDMAAASIGRTGTPWKGHFAAMEVEGYDFSQCLQAIRRGAGHYYLPGPAPRRESRKPVFIPPRKIWLSTATIVVVPSNLVQQWRHEIRKHTIGLKVLVMNSNKGTLPAAKELAEFDIILFSRQRFEKEARDGSDNQGRRRTTTNSVCRCPYIGSTRERDCTCFREEDTYRSPLKDLHFKRLITDEGHNFGNASSSSKTEAVTVVDFLQLTSRWIVSGTPTQGLYGAEVALGNSEGSSMSHTPIRSDVDDLAAGAASKLWELDSPDNSSETSNEQEKASYRQERKDLEKLGNIATTYLKAHPWANSLDDNESASWSQHVMQPRHGSKSHGNMDCLKSTLEGMIIRHRPEDVSLDVTLPPLNQSVVLIEGSFQDKLSLNLFSMMIVSNAVTSERKDNDYLFHPRQRKPLQQLVSNLRQASFFWSGYTREDVQVAIEIAKKFLEKREVPITDEDEVLLKDAIKVGEIILANNIFKEISHWHEMPMYVDNECPEAVRAAWALDEDTRNPTLMGATMVHGLHDFVSKQLWKEDPMEGLMEEGKKARIAAYIAQYPPTSTRFPTATKKDTKSIKKAEQATPALAGGVSVGHDSSPKKRSRPSIGTMKPVAFGSDIIVDASSAHKAVHAPRQLKDNKITAKPKSALKKSKATEIIVSLDPSAPLASTAIVSTSSAKLSYLMDRIVTYQSTEKIIVFYEADNVAFYIAQALELLGIEYLIYAKSLASSRRSDYVVTFNQSEAFRVLLMDVSQAAFGLDMSSASRVYFVNPVFSPQIEAQAVKRAHRIGQTKPVYVETLVLKGSIEEVILERRKDMSIEEHNKCKSILDDQTMYDWIRNVRFLTLPPDDVIGPDQMAKLDTPVLVFGRGATRIGERDPDAGLVFDSLSPIAKGKSQAKEASFADKPLSGGKAKGKRKLAFAIPEKDGYMEATSTDDEREREKRDRENAQRTYYPTFSNSMLIDSGIDPTHGPFRDVSSSSSDSLDDLDPDEDDLRLISARPLSNPLRSFRVDRNREYGLGSCFAASGNEFGPSMPTHLTPSDQSAINPDPLTANRGYTLISHPRMTFSRTCDYCESSKIRCDGIEPRCTSCTQSRRDCMYATPDRWLSFQSTPQSSVTPNSISSPLINPRSMSVQEPSLSPATYFPPGIFSNTLSMQSPALYLPSRSSHSILTPVAQPMPQTSSAPQLSTSLFLNPKSSPVDDDKIEYSTPRPRTKRTRTEVLGIRLPNGEFKIPPRSYTYGSSSTLEASNSSLPGTPDSGLSLAINMSGGEASRLLTKAQAKAQRAKLDGNTTRSLLVKLKIACTAEKIREIEEKSNAWRMQMSYSGAKIGKKGWERTDARVDEPPMKKYKGIRNIGEMNDDGDDAFVS